MEKPIAILMAAGLGTRMRPITNNIPKPLVQVNGTPMIETLITGLQRCGVEQFYIVTGYLAQQFHILTTKYHHIHLIENLEYMHINNISSLYAVRDILGDSDCFICESDIYVRDYHIFDTIPSQSCYYGKWMDGYSDDWVFDIDEHKKITSIHKQGTSKYNMTGICYLKKKDAKALSAAIKHKYQTPGFETLFWDEVLSENLKNISLTIKEVLPEQLIEIDTVEELEQMNNYLKNHL